MLVQGGVRIRSVGKLGPLHGIAESDDVLLAVDGHKIAAVRNLWQQIV